MTEPFLGEIRRISWNFPPKGWAFCNGQLLPINQNQALFSLLGTTYGGDGRQTFALPNLQGRSPIDPGAGITAGEVGGETTHTLNVSELPAHTHAPGAVSGAATTADPTNALWATTPQPAYGASAQTAMDPSTIQPTGGNQPHENQSPYLVINYIIALQGIFPSQN